VSRNDRERQFLAFVAQEEALTRLTNLGWAKRLDSIAAFFPDGLEAGPVLDDPGMRLDALYWMAQALNLHGFPGRALTAYSQHDELCRSMGPSQSKRLASAIAHHAKSLRQCGRFHDADILAREGLDLQQRVGDQFAIAINLYWFGMGLAHRGETSESVATLDEALAMLGEGTRADDTSEPTDTCSATDQERAVVSAFSAQRALWDGDLDTAERQADLGRVIGERLAASPVGGDEFGARKILSATTRMTGEVLLLRGKPVEANLEFVRSLQLAGDVTFIEEVIPSLRGLAATALAVNDIIAARRWLDASFPLTHQGPYPLYDADAHLLLAELEVRSGNPMVARAAATRAANLAWCDGRPFTYERGYQDAEAFLTRHR
jgi:hypothetical protein